MEHSWVGKRYTVYTLLRTLGERCLEVRTGNSFPNFSQATQHLAASLVHIRAYHPFCTKPLCEPTQAYQLDPWDKFQWNLNQNTTIFIWASHWYSISLYQQHWCDNPYCDSSFPIWIGSCASQELKTHTCVFIHKFCFWFNTWYGLCCSSGDSPTSWRKPHASAHLWGFGLHEFSPKLRSWLML